MKMVVKKAITWTKRGQLVFELSHINVKNLSTKSLLIFTRFSSKKDFQTFFVKFLHSFIQKKSFTSLKRQKLIIEKKICKLEAVI